VKAGSSFDFVFSSRATSDEVDEELGLTVGGASPL
jgi:hypothetical protein